MGVVWLYGCGLTVWAGSASTDVAVVWAWPIYMGVV